MCRFQGKMCPYFGSFTSKRPEEPEDGANSYAHRRHLLLLAGIWGCYVVGAICGSALELRMALAALVFPPVCSRGASCARSWVGLVCLLPPRRVLAHLWVRVWGTAHDEAHNAFITLRPYTTVTREGEATQLRRSPKLWRPPFLLTMM